jgi:two-component system, chemotaxis family, CheB/CheR fusion protein
MEPQGAQPHKKNGNRTKPRDNDPASQMESIAIVGIGASAGGLEALESFFAHAPPDTGMAFVIIQHLSPTYKSAMDDLLRKRTNMKVMVTEDGMKVEPGSIYLNPPDREVAIFNGVLHLVDPVSTRGFRLPIDHFFRSLAEDQGERAICIILSGTGTDGTAGLRAVKGVGGLIMVQDQNQAKYDGMPRSAIDTGLIDYILPVEKMPEQLMEYVRQPYVRGKSEPAASKKQFQNYLQKIFMLIRSNTGHDFSNYKQNTIRRRIERRMAVHKIARIEDYSRFLQRNQEEVSSLFRDLLIGVTGFFRDPDAFRALEEKVLTSLVMVKTPASPLRVWVPGCATGEEAYSIAILITEAMEKAGRDLKVQVFASDVDDQAIELARAGDYPEGITADVTAERLERYFMKDGHRYRVKKQIREMVVFAVQNVTSDPPFSKLDLISCRNLLIYMDMVLQKKILSVFHYTLNEGGYLLLGTSESVGEFIDLFAPVDTKWKLFRRKGSVAQHTTEHRGMPFADTAHLAQRAEEKRMARPTGARELAERAILESHSPPCVLIDDDYDILYFKGSTEKYLVPPIGDASLNILKMAREGLRPALSTALFKVVRQKMPIVCEGLQVRQDDRVYKVDVIIRPIDEPDLAQNLILIVFDEKPASKKPVRRKKSPEAEGDPRVLELEQELRSTKEYLQSTIEELETANEELKATNEELQSANEELQSTNEELETSKEEMQSTNEELLTVNAELQNKLEELSQANNDINNLLASTDVGTIFLDNRLHIKRFTPSITKLLNVITADIGRPIGDITHKVAYGPLYKDAEEVLETLHRKEVEVQTELGNWFSLRILPYRTVENMIDGVVLTFVDITRLKQAELDACDAKNFAESIVNTVRESLLVLDADLRVVSANEGFHRTFGTSPKEIEKVLVYELGDGQWDIPQLRTLLEDIVSENSSFRDFELEHDFPGIGYRKMLLNAHRVQPSGDHPGLILLAIEDVTDRK